MALRAPSEYARQEARPQGEVLFDLALRPTAYRRFGKRLFDLTLGIPLFVFVLPLIALLALGIAATSGGSPFYGASRVGKEGLPFRMWKLRTMVKNADSQPARWREVSPGIAEIYFKGFKLTDDPRVTRFGRILRKTSLDELPQLWNVIRGDMSLVGPRPIVADEVLKYGRNAHVFLSTPPGMTGAWQVSGRNAIEYPERTYVELEYIAAISLQSDVRILGQTALTLLRPNGI